MKRAKAAADDVAPPKPVTVPVGDRGVGDRGVSNRLPAGPEAFLSPALRAGALVLHDDEATLALLRGVVGAVGFETARPTSVFDLLAGDPPAAPRLVVLGLTAIDERDLEIVERLRRRWPDAWILALHPASLRERAKKALELGADATLPEPFYPSEITALALRAMARTATATVPVIPTHSQPPVAAAPPPPPQPTAPPASTPISSLHRLAASVAHAIRDPVEVLEKRLDEAEAEGDVNVPALRSELSRISELGEGLSRFAGPSGLALRPVDLTSLVTSVFVSRGVGAAGAEIGVKFGEAGVEILAAEDHLRAGLESVRNRAVRVTPPEGRISVRTRRRDDGGATQVEITVTDGGPALTDAARASLFDPFPEEGVEDGTGLELAALAGIVRVHGGSVTALAAGATGTIVVVRLPVRAEAKLS